MHKNALNRILSLFSVFVRQPDDRGRPSVTILTPISILFLGVSLGLAQPPAPSLEPHSPPPPPAPSTLLQDNFDRLDGTGPSHVKVHVVEWEGNLEIHVTPKGALQGLGIKYEKENKSRSILILAYRLGLTTSPLVRRAILGIPWPTQVQAYRDLSADGYDKIIFSGTRPSEGRIVPFRLDAPPQQNYPQGHPSATPENPPLG